MVQAERGEVSSPQTSLCEAGIDMLLEPKPKPVRGAHLYKHGLRYTPEYNVWCLMKNRCHNPKYRRYQEWGGRGIAVCMQWRYDFEAFLKFVGPRPSSLHSIDRVDNDKGYEPGNVRWATRQEQSGNRPTFVRAISFNGRTETISEWARILDLRRDTLKWRLNNWSLDRALSSKVVR